MIPYNIEMMNQDKENNQITFSKNRSGDHDYAIVININDEVDDGNEYVSPEEYATTKERTPFSIINKQKLQE